MSVFKDRTNTKYGRLTVLEPVGNDGYGHITWLCKCECGNETIVSGHSLTSKKTRSCGCFNREEASKRGDASTAGFRGIITTYKFYARKRGHSWELSKDEARELMGKDCYYCGAQPSNQRKEFTYNGLDRIDNTKGYINSNVVPCCKICNRAKADLSQEEFIEWLDNINRFFGRRARKNWMSA